MLGDGNEDVSCNLSKDNWEVSESPSETLSKLEAEKYFDSLLCRFLKFLIYPSIASKLKFTLKMNEVPPVLNSLASGDVLYNSEHCKDSKILKNRDKLYGNQEMLVYMLGKGEIVLDKLNGYSHNELLELCHKLEFKNLSRSFGVDNDTIYPIIYYVSVFQVQQ